MNVLALTGFAVFSLAASAAAAPTLEIRTPCDADGLLAARAAPRVMLHCKDESLNLLAIPSGHLIRSWSASELAVSKDRVSGATISPDGSALAASFFDATLLVLRADRGAPVRSLKTDAYVNNLRFSADGRTLIADQRRIEVDPELTIRGRIPTAFDTVNEVAFSNDGRRLAAFGADTSISLWSLPDLKPLARHDGEPVEPFAGAFSGDGKALVVGMADGRMLVLDPGTLVLRRTVRAPPKNSVTAVEAVGPSTMLIRYRPWIGGDSAWGLLDLGALRLHPLSPGRKVDAVIARAGRVWGYALDGAVLVIWPLT